MPANELILALMNYYFIEFESHQTCKLMRNSEEIFSCIPAGVFAFPKRNFPIKKETILYKKNVKIKLNM
jgi:hypothetical protein